MSEIADWLTQDYCESNALDAEPLIWVDHKGNEWRLSQAEFRPPGRDSFHP